MIYGTWKSFLFSGRYISPAILLLFGLPSSYTMSTPSGSRQPHVPSYSDSPNSSSTLLEKLSRKTIKLEYENEVLETESAKLRSANIKLKQELSDATQTILLRDARVSSLIEKMSSMEHAIGTTESDVRINKKKYIRTMEDLERAQEVMKAQAVEIAQLKQLKATLVAQVERTPAPPRQKPLHGPSEFHPMGPPLAVGHNQQGPHQGSSYGNPATPYHPLDGRSSFPPRQGQNPGHPTSQQRFVGPGANQHGLPSIPPPAARQITIQHPSELTKRVNDLALDNKSPVILSPENESFAIKFKEIFSDVERFAKRWTFPLQEKRGYTLFGPPPSISKEWNAFDNVSAISQVWSSKDLRHTLVVRTIVEDFILTRWNLTNLYSFPGASNLVQKLQAIQDSLQGASGLQRSLLFVEQGRLIASLDNQTAIREEWISQSSTIQASKLFNKLQQVISRDPTCAREMTALYVKAARLSFFIWSHSSSWSWVFSRGGSSSHWNPFRDELKNEELMGLSRSEIQARDMRVLFCSTPSITRITYPSGSIHTQLICLCGVVLSRDGITVDRHGL